MNPTPNPNRRDFLKRSGATVAAVSIASPFILTSKSAAADLPKIKVGLVGSGGRGSGAASQALHADKGVILTAIGDAFPDQLQKGLNGLKAEKDVADRIQVSPDNQFVGLDAYKKVIDSGVDLVILASPPGFRALHMKYAVAKNKHVFAEKPIATDAAGYRSFIESVKLAKQKNLAVGSGFCWRSHLAQRGAYERIHAGDIGDVRTIYGTYNTSPPRTPIKREDGWTDMEYVVRNWMQFSWLSGDCLVEQAIHNVDLTNWAMKNEMPVKAIAHGGRQIRPEGGIVGNNFDHFAVVYEWKNGVRGFVTARQIPGCDNDNSETVYGSKGTAHILLFRGNPYITDLSGERKWRYSGPTPNMYQVEHDELFASIRAGKPRNDGDWLANSTMMGIMGRMAGYTGKDISWEQATTANDSVAPLTDISLNDKPPVAELPQPGKTRIG